MRCLFYVILDWWSHTGSDSTAFDDVRISCGVVTTGAVKLPENFRPTFPARKHQRSSPKIVTPRPVHTCPSYQEPPSTEHHTPTQDTDEKAWRHNAPTPARHYDVILRSCTITYGKNPGKFRLTCWGWRSPTHSDLKIYIDSLHLKL